MKNILSTIFTITFVTTAWSAEDAKQLFRKAFSGDKKAKADLISKFPNSEFTDAIRIFDATPDSFDQAKTADALAMADALVLRAPKFGLGHFLRATLHFDFASNDEAREKEYGAALLEDVKKIKSLGYDDELAVPAQAQLKMMTCFGEYAVSNYAAALAQCDEGLKLAKNDEELHRYRALTLYMMQNFSEAVKSFDIALKKNPKNTYLLNLRGISKLQSQDFKGALADANSGKKIDPNLVDFMVLSARAKVALGKRRDGCVELQSARAMATSADPDVWISQLCQ